MTATDRVTSVWTDGSESESGDVEVRNGKLMVTSDLDGVEEAMDYTLTGNTMTLSYMDDEAFDFDDDGPDDPGEWGLVLEKR